MTDEFIVDMSDVDDYDGNDFTPLPRGVYRVMVESYTEDREVKNAGGKIPKGTKGTNFAFIVVDDENYEGRKLWASYWHHPVTAGFFKQLYKASGAFSDDEFQGSMDILENRDRIIGQELYVKVAIRPAKGEYSASNDVKAFIHVDDHKEAPTASGGDADIDDLMP